MTVPAMLRKLVTVEPTPAARLGLTRLLLGGYTLYYLGRRRQMLRQVVRTDPALFEPVGPPRVLSHPIPVPVADALNDANLVSTALFTAGIGHRLFGPVHAALLTWTLSYRNSWSKIFHNDNTLVLHTLLLGAAPAADAISLARCGGARTTPLPHPRYGWPLYLMNAASAATYLLAGVAKVAGPSGWSWASGDELRRHIAVDAVRKEVYGSRAAPFGKWLYRYRQLFGLFAIGSLALELGAPLALLHRRAGRVWAVSAFGMHWGIRAIMGITFRYQMSGAGFVAWFDLERLVSPWRRGSRPGRL